MTQPEIVKRKRRHVRFEEVSRVDQNYDSGDVPIVAGAFGLKPNVNWRAVQIRGIKGKPFRPRVVVFGVPNANLWWRQVWLERSRTTLAGSRSTAAGPRRSPKWRSSIRPPAATPFPSPRKEAANCSKPHCRGISLRPPKAAADIAPIRRRGQGSNRRDRSYSWPSRHRFRSRSDAADWSDALNFASKSAARR